MPIPLDAPVTTTVFSLKVSAPIVDFLSLPFAPCNVHQRPKPLTSATSVGSPQKGQVTPTLQKSRMPQILDVEGEAVVLYREASTTQEIRYPRLSRRVNNMASLPLFKMPPAMDSSKALKMKTQPVFVAFKLILPFYLCNYGG